MEDVMVYFIQGEQTKLIKIGKADDVLVRLRMLQCGSPDRLVVLKVDTESASDRLHHLQFAANRVHGEWFNPAVALTAFIESIPSSKFDGLTYVTQFADVPVIPQCLTWRWSGKVRHAEPCTCDSPLTASWCRNYSVERG
jgi:T5orf172 domain